MIVQRVKGSIMNGLWKRIGSGAVLVAALTVAGLFVGCDENKPTGDASTTQMTSWRTVSSGDGEVGLLGTEVRVGEKAPQFTCIGRDMQPVSLADYAGKVKILSVFPSIDTRVCSLQTHQFNEQADALGDGVVIMSISVDLPFAMNRYCGAEGIERMVMASDHRDLDFGMKYGMVLEGKRLLTRAVVVIDKDDVVRYVEYVPNLSDEPDYAKALDVAKGLLGN